MYKSKDELSKIIRGKTNRAIVTSILSLLIWVYLWGFVLDKFFPDFSFDPLPVEDIPTFLLIFVLFSIGGILFLVTANCINYLIAGKMPVCSKCKKSLIPKYFNQIDYAAVTGKCPNCGCDVINPNAQQQH